MRNFNNEINPTSKNSQNADGENIDGENDDGKDFNEFDDSDLDSADEKTKKQYTIFKIKILNKIIRSEISQLFNQNSDYKIEDFKTEILSSDFITNILKEYESTFKRKKIPSRTIYLLILKDLQNRFKKQNNKIQLSDFYYLDMSLDYKNKKLEKINIYKYLNLFGYLKYETKQYDTFFYNNSVKLGIDLKDPETQFEQELNLQKIGEFKKGLREKEFIELQNKFNYDDINHISYYFYLAKKLKKSDEEINSFFTSKEEQKISLLPVYLKKKPYFPTLFKNKSYMQRIKIKDLLLILYKSYEQKLI
ncbi:MAG: hypothetical protein WC872_04220 [Candidatus Absconditabacterales bacterium]